MWTRLSTSWRHTARKQRRSQKRALATAPTVLTLLSRLPQESPGAQNCRPSKPMYLQQWYTSNQGTPTSASFWTWSKVLCTPQELANRRTFLLFIVSTSTFVPLSFFACPLIPCQNGILRPRVVICQLTPFCVGAQWAWYFCSISCSFTIRTKLAPMQCIKYSNLEPTTKCAPIQ